MNYIGNKLKALRQELGLTQTEMAAGVISVSFYSKVERGLNDIGVNDFLEILKNHDVTPVDFFGNYKKNKKNRKKVTVLMNELVKAANEDNDNKINSLIEDFETISPKTPFVSSLILQAKIILNTHNSNALNKLTDIEKKKIKQIVFQKDTDENDYLRLVLIANVIQVYKIDDAFFLIKSIIRRYKNVDNLSKKIVIALSSLMINYIDWCIRKERSSFCYIAISYIRSLPNYVEISFSKILCEYYEDILEKNDEKAKNVLSILVAAGYGENVKRMAKSDFQI
ncbi:MULTISPECIES: helix-turn-helix domain-containing protein [unclassified Lactobacillus]|uniref:helix-turn-helix domain-containing protein n=1 Tax=unclassified Lactobacillus TaxID=2620435 RepID=UPI0018DC39ED|nr:MULTISPECIES: Rgg/GadR/MutR family transcriptional regulator [unclassified Lactobacillus]MBH9989268.1 helix-turn-helix domain-containing protein [Lactobacillus sp. M0392]MBI0023879.1 helix-turn-helix domain-containing protein [Lactobacillus sp. W8171]MBI0044309.1 helix-turn-helix domain-containing protein [Lactobacillus sp. M0393]MCT6902232.1 helix-turn-helix transcriptional regulator [Lactobacillus sp.]